MIKYLSVLLVSVFALANVAFGDSRINDLSKPGVDSSLVFGRIVAENAGSGTQIAIRELVSDFEIRVSLEEGIFKAYLPKGIYRIASLKHGKIDEKFSFLKAKKLKDCFFVVPSPNKTYYIGDILVDLSKERKERVKESKGIPMESFVYTYHIDYSVKDEFDEAVKAFKGLSEENSNIEKSLINRNIDIEKLTAIRETNSENRSKLMDDAIKDAAKDDDRYFFIFRFGGYFGGDKIASIYSDSVHTGDGAEISLGVFFKPFENRNHETQITLGSLDTRTEEFDNYYELERYTAEVMQYYRFRYVRAGVGLTYHMNPVLKGHGTVSGERIKFDDTLGFTLETDAFFGFRDFAEIFLGLRYTFIDYESESKKYDGDSMGIVLGFYF